MMKVVSVVVVLLALTVWVNSTCISENDHFTLIGTPNLTYIDPFSIRLFNTLYPPNASGNFFFSPFSIWNALGLAYLGSKGKTEEQLQSALGTINKSNALATIRGVEAFYKKIQAESNIYTVDLANRMYVDESFQLPQCVREVLSKEVENIDFDQGDVAAAKINAFVNDTTRGKIPNLVTAGDVQGAPMVLVNAAYFKGLWLKPFSPDSTKKELFYSSPSQSSLVDMMTLTADFKIGDSYEVGATILEMPYKEKRASMFVFLPHTTDDGTIPIEAMLSRLNHYTLRGAISKLFYNEVIVKIPKFKLEQTITEELKTALQHLGIVDLFTSDADLSVYDPSGYLRVKKGIHKAVVEVNEEGAEAAAATALIFEITSGSISEPLEFRCDRPFLFFIHDNDTSNILFMGVYRQPQN